MVYKPPVKTSETVNGLARITKAKRGEQKYWRVMLTQGKDDEAKVTECFIKPDNVPTYLTVGEWRVRLSSDKVKILSAIPADAIVTAEFKDIGHREGEEPAPYKKMGKFGETFQFVWIWQICDGEFEGIEVRQYLTYNFDYSNDEKGNTVLTYSHPASKPTKQLEQVLVASGFWNKGAAPFKENVLPLIKKRVIREREENGVKVQLHISEGYVIAVKPLTSGWDSEDAEEEVETTEPAPSKPAPKSKKPVKQPEPVEEEVIEETSNDKEIPWDDDDKEE